MISTLSTIVPGLQYRDAPAAIEWLCRMFGFAKHLVIANPDGTIAHAQLTLGGGMVMLGTAKSPMDAGSNFFINLSVSNPDEIYARVQDNGGTITLPIQDQDYGGRSFTCRDPESNLWTVGSYDPWLTT